MKFSVIIPVYNVEPYLEECVDSVLHQTCKDFEILLLDDGSTDKSGVICDAYAESYPECIRVFHQQNQGANQTRVNGIQAAVGDVCIFVDSDDMLWKDALEQIHGVFEKTGCDLVLYTMSNKSDYTGAVETLPLENGQSFEGEEKKTLYTLMVESGKLNSMCTKAAKKSLYDAFIDEYHVDPDMGYGEDLYLALPLVTLAKKTVFLKEKLYYYRQREGSMVHSFSPKLHRSVKIVRQEVERYIEHWGIQACYPVFYTRVIRNWLQALKNLMKNQRNMEKETVISILHELGEDEFFRKAYEHMEPGGLSKRDALLANWLYRHRYTALRLLGGGFYTLKGGRF